MPTKAICAYHWALPALLAGLIELAILWIVERVPINGLMALSTVFSLIVRYSYVAVNEKAYILKYHSPLLQTQGHPQKQVHPGPRPPSGSWLK